MYLDSLGYKQNNVGNLRGNGIAWQGKTGMNKGFSVFSERIYGIRAMYIDLLNKFKSGQNTIVKIITQYAPPIENDTVSYIKFMEKQTGVGASEKMNGTILDVRKLVLAIAMKETGYKITETEIEETEKIIFQKKK
jgi:hypothetical protein